MNRDPRTGNSSGHDGPRGSSYSGKIFGIGFHKTGTTSLASALRMLGYRVCGPVGIRDPEIGEKLEAMVLPLVEGFDAFQDNPWPLLYRELDRRCPGSKFILTLRASESWLGSIVRHFGGQSTPMRELIYGAGDPRGNEDVYLRTYQRHNREVLEYFRNRPSDLLVLEITSGEGWEKLCPFLNVPVPDVDFPHSNSVRQRRMKAARRMVARLLKPRRNP